jgi:hypothetical protein
LTPELIVGARTVECVETKGNPDVCQATSGELHPLAFYWQIVVFGKKTLLPECMYRHAEENLLVFEVGSW